jgi:hypothetical protein
MARVDLLHGRGLQHLFYNVDAAVGKNAPNRKDDVMLVQYLLKNATTLGFPQVFKWNLLNYPIAGLWDKNWQGLLSAYIDAEAGIGNKMVADGRVDPALTGRITGPVHHRQYVIVVLNLKYSIVRSADYPRLAEVADCPAELRLPLKWQVLKNP